MLSLRFRLIITCITVLICASSYSQTTSTDLQVIEKRNAATLFVSVREQFAFSMIRECTPLLTNAPAYPLSVVSSWYERNFAEIEASKVWLTEYFVSLQKQNPQAARAAQQAFLQENSRSLLEIVRLSFSQKLPDEASCKRVLSQFAPIEMDFSNIGKQPGYSQFAEFSQTLREYKSSANYLVPSTLRFGVTESQLAASQMVASLVAADAAYRARDAASYLAAYQNLALQGDGKAAQTIGISYLNGDLLAKDANQAYSWFYAAFTLADYEGANAMGVMHRDGLIQVGNDRVVAQASFSIASLAARTLDARNRAQSNFNRLDALLTNDEKFAVGCMSLSQLDAIYKKKSSLLIKGTTINHSQRVLRDNLPSSLIGYRSDTPC